jgi:hypothetical protein
MTFIHSLTITHSLCYSWSSSTCYLWICIEYRYKSPIWTPIPGYVSPIGLSSLADYIYCREFPRITVMSVRKFKIRRISEVLTGMLIVPEHAMTKFIVLNVSFKKRALQIGLPRDKNRNCRTNENLEIASLHHASIWDICL